MKLKLLTCLFGLFVVAGAGAQTISIEEYIQKYRDIAIQEMIRTGVPASITLAQGIVETENGNSKLVKKSNNHFGIKCKETWTGPSVSHDDDAPGECFRKYNSAEESYIDHSNFLKTRKHYAFLFELDPVDYKSWAYGLKKAGYATNPRYPDLLIKYIETYDLNEYSLVALGKKKAEEVVIAKTEDIKVVTSDEKPVRQTPGAVTKPAVISAKPAKEKTETVKVEVVQKPAVNYPTGEFKINETRVIYATKGTPFLAIAQQYNVQLKWLFDFNDLKEAEVLAEDQLVYLQRKRRTGANEFHVMVKGESLYHVAQTEGIRMEALLQYNFLKENQHPAAGEKLYLKNQAPGAPKLALQENDQLLPAVLKPLKYIVQPKQTLYSSSKKYEVSANKLQQWNNLGNTGLKEGMELIINN
jgi:LysM repeat protein